MCDTLGYFLKTWYILASNLLSKDKSETSVAFTVTSVVYEYRDSYVLRLPVVHVDTVAGCSLSKVQSRQTRAHHYLRKSSKQRLVNAFIDSIYPNEEFLVCTMNLVLCIKEWNSLIQSTRFMRRATKFWVSWAKLVAWSIFFICLAKSISKLIPNLILARIVAFSPVQKFSLA